jgi:hypothetical protein
LSTVLPLLPEDVFILWRLAVKMIFGRARRLVLMENYGIIPLNL